MPTDMSTWAPVTRHYRTDDGQDFAVECSVDAIPAGAVSMIDELVVALGSTLGETNQVLRPTVVLPCGPDGSPLGDTVPAPLFTFEPGVSHDEALALAGYPVESSEGSP